MSIRTESTGSRPWQAYCDDCLWQDQNDDSGMRYRARKHAEKNMHTVVINYERQVRITGLPEKGST